MQTVKPRRNSKSEMVKQDITGVKISDSTGIPKPTLSKILNGRVNPTEREANLISKVLNKPADELFA